MPAITYRVVRPTAIEILGSIIALVAIFGSIELLFAMPLIRSAGLL